MTSSSPDPYILTQIQQATLCLEQSQQRMQHLIDEAKAQRALEAKAKSDAAVYARQLNTLYANLEQYETDLEANLKIIWCQKEAVLYEGLKKEAEERQQVAAKAADLIEAQLTQVRKDIEKIKADIKSLGA